MVQCTVHTTACETERSDGQTSRSEKLSSRLYPGFNVQALVLFLNGDKKRSGLLETVLFCGFIKIVYYKNIKAVIDELIYV